MRSKVKLI